jgi:hypothetical protein
VLVCAVFAVAPEAGLTSRVSVDFSGPSRDVPGCVPQNAPLCAPWRLCA